jgi:hypothetical protein
LLLFSYWFASVVLGCFWVSGVVLWGWCVWLSEQVSLCGS